MWIICAVKQRQTNGHKLLKYVAKLAMLPDLIGDVEIKESFVNIFKGISEKCPTNKPYKCSIVPQFVGLRIRRVTI